MPARPAVPAVILRNLRRERVAMVRIFPPGVCGWKRLDRRVEEPASRGGLSPPSRERSTTPPGVGAGAAGRETAEDERRYPLQTVVVLHLGEGDETAAASF